MAAQSERDKSAGLGGGARRTREQAMGGVATLLVLLIIGMVNYLAYRHYKRIDMTSEGIFTLSPKTEQVLAELSEPVDIYLFMAQNEGSFETADELLKRYKAKSSLVRLHHVDPEREAAEFKVLAQRFGVLAGAMETGQVQADVAAVVARGDKNWHVDRDDLVGVDFGPMPGEDEVEVNVKAEQALTGAILQVVSGRPTKVCVTQGHGEWSLEEADERTLATLQFATRHDNLEWQAFETLGAKEVPKGCDAVLVIGPVRPFSQSEATLLDGYLAGGGNLLLALDPVIEQDAIAPSGFEAVLEQRGVRLDRALVIEADPKRLITQNAVEFLATEFNDHATTKALAGAGRVLMVLARSVSATGENDTVTPLVRTSEQAYGETDLKQVSANDAPGRGAGDLPGPLSVAVALRVLPPSVGEDLLEKHRGGRLLVVGDADFLQPALLQTPELENYLLMSSFVGWLTEREALIAIPPKKVKGGELVLSQDDLSAIFFRVVVLLPGAMMLCGIGVWLGRRG